MFQNRKIGSMMGRYFCIEFIDFNFNNKSLTDSTNSFLPNNFQENDKIIRKYSQ